MSATVTRAHTDKLAYVYLRQSTPAQVRENRESTDRQYALREKALAMGWPAERIRTLDGDLGMSGTGIRGRDDFKRVMADLAMGEVGAIFALEVPRLSRCGADWHRLLDVCALTDTLIVESGGCYNASDFNDEILLTIKGTMARGELRTMHERLHEAKLNKARRGELRAPLPVGLARDHEGKVVLDPDAEVRGAVQLVFETFRETGSAYGAVQSFLSRGLRFPKRTWGGTWDGKLVWGRLSHARALGVLKNPAYAGAYVYGRFRAKKTISPEGEVRTTTCRMQTSSWLVTIKDHHEGYIGWDEYLVNQERLERNRTNGEETVLRGPARQGTALLTGLLLCGGCGRRLTVRYQGDGGVYPVYECNWKKREGLGTGSCLSVRAHLLDHPVAERALAALDPVQVRVALDAVERVKEQDEALLRQWQMQIERAEYEAQLAQRRYEAVDPENRLVASTLERRWNEALSRLEGARQDFAEHRKAQSRIPDRETEERLLVLAADVRRLWNAPSTSAKDKKRMLRLLVADVTVWRQPATRTLRLGIRFRGGTTEEVELALPPRVSDRLRTPRDLVDRVAELAPTLSDDEVARTLNDEGWSSPKGSKFHAGIVKWIRYRYEIAGRDPRRPGELTVRETADKFGVNPGVVYYWLERGMLEARRKNQGTPYWITLSPEKEVELATRVADSSKIQAGKMKNPEV